MCDVHILSTPLLRLTLAWCTDRSSANPDSARTSRGKLFLCAEAEKFQSYGTLITMDKASFSLFTVSPHGLGRRYRISKSAVLGRHHDCEIQLLDVSVSKHHAQLTQTEHGYELSDLGSRNGVFVNGSRIEVPKLLVTNDVISIGNCALIFNPDFAMLPEDNSGRALLLLSDNHTLELAAQRRETPQPPDVSVISRGLFILESCEHAHEVFPKLLDWLNTLIASETSAVVMRTGDSFEVLGMRTKESTTSIPHQLLDQCLKDERGIIVSDFGPEMRFADGKTQSESHNRSVALAPCMRRDAFEGVIFVASSSADRYRESDLDLLLSIAPLCAHAAYLHRLLTERRSDRALRSTTEPTILGRSAAIGAVKEFISKAAAVSSSVLISGETGTGKELIARALHKHSAWAAEPFVALNCGAIPESLMESELFGFERGAFSGAMRQTPGKLELANGGTLFLDEVAELSSTLQVKLLRALEERCFYRLGGGREIAVKFRLVAATHRDLSARVREGKFREDLLYRLHVLSIKSPALRERRDDIPLLARHFFEGFARELGRTFSGFDGKALTVLTQYAWPGNIRQLRNVMESLAVLCSGTVVQVSDLPLEIRTPSDKATAHPNTLSERIAQVEHAGILEALKQARGKKSEAARALGISRPTLDKKVKELGIDIFDESSD